MGALYLITNTKNQKRYVGITLRTVKARWARHVRNAQRGSKLPLHNAIRKHGADAFKVRTLKKSDDWDELCRWEVETIAKLKTHVRYGGYNATAGSEGIVDPTEEVKAKLSAVAKRLNADPEFRAKHLKAMKRMWADDEFRAKISKAMRTPLNNFCREHGLNRKHVRRRLCKRGLYGLKNINDPRVRAVLDEMIAERQPAKKPRHDEAPGLTLH